jgi:hypothetical protein
MTRRLVLASLMVAAACHRDDAPRPSEGDDPWDHPAPAKPAAHRPPRKLSMDGTIDAPPELLATPLPGYADAKVGDWRAYTYVTVSGTRTFHATAIAEVTAVSAATVTIELRGRLAETGEQRSDGEDELPRAITVAHEIHHKRGDWAASDVQLTDDVRIVGGRSFPCKKLAFSSVDPMLPGKTVRNEVWLAPGIPVGGEIAAHEVQAMPSLTITSNADIIGFGDAAHTTWGTRPAGL